MNAQPPDQTAGQPSGERVLPAQFEPGETALRSRRSQNPLVQALGRVWRMRTGRFGVVVVTLLVFAAIAAPVLAPYSPSEQFRGDELEAPSARYLLGTDQLGRDLLSRVIYASRASLIAGVLAVSFGAFVGVIYAPRKMGPTSRW